MPNPRFRSDLTIFFEPAAQSLAKPSLRSGLTIESSLLARLLTKRSHVLAFDEAPDGIAAHGGEILRNSAKHRAG
jgi:hypothetical protein